MTTALYLAHLNPVTNAHVEIINELKKEMENIQVKLDIAKLKKNKLLKKNIDILKKKSLHNTSETNKTSERTFRRDTFYNRVRQKKKMYASFLKIFS